MSPSTAMPSARHSPPAPPASPASKPDWRCSSRRAARRSAGDGDRRSAPPRPAGGARSAKRRGRRVRTSAPRASTAARTARLLHAPVLARDAEPIGDVAAGEARAHLAALGVERCTRPVAQSAASSAAEGHDPRHRKPRALRLKPLEDTGCRGSARRCRRAPGLRKSRLLASAMASSEPKNSRCAGAIVVISATCGRAMPTSAPRSRRHGSCRARSTP